MAQRDVFCGKCGQKLSVDTNRKSIFCFKCGNNVIVPAPRTTEIINVFMVCDDEDIYEQLKKMIYTDDDIDGEVVGTKDGSVRIFMRGESVWLKTKTSSNDKVILIGNVKSSSDLDPQIQFNYYGHGVKCGFTGNYAKIVADEMVVNASDIEYQSLISDLDTMPVNDEFKGDKKNRQVGKSVVKTTLVPFAFVGEAKKNLYDIPKMIKKQLYLYGVVKFYYNDLTKFLYAEQNTDLVLKKTSKEKEQKPIAPKNKLEQELINAVEEYNSQYALMKGCGEELYTERIRSCDVINNVAALINSIANHPKSFDTEMGEIEILKRQFEEEASFAKKELEVARASAAGAVTGISSGAAIMFVAPKAAMWIATTFGTSSTGTAISSLSGAAATKAALAWLGGGAASAGGGGAAAGSSLLAMAGPIGIGVAAVTILSSIVLIEYNKAKQNKERKEETDYIRQNTEIIKEAGLKIGVMMDECKSLFDGLIKSYTDCLAAFGKEYTALDEQTQYKLGALVNNTKALAASLGKKLK